MTLVYWWLPLLLAAAAIWAAILLPRLVAEHHARGQFVQTLTLAVLAVAPVVVVATGPHLGPLDPPEAGVFGPVTVWAGRLGVAALLLLAAVAVLAPAARAHVGRPLVLALAGLASSQVVTFAGSATGATYALLPVAPAVVSYASAAGWPATVRGLRWALRVVVAPSLMLAFTGPAWATLTDPGRSFAGFGRLAGLTAHPNVLGPAAAALVLLELARPRGRGWIAWTAAAATVLALTQSRTALLGAGVGVLWMLASSGGVRRWVAAAGSVAAVVGLAYSPPDLGTLTGRTEIWRIAWGEFTAHPLLGYGAGFLGPEYRAALPVRLQWAGQAHNQLFHTLGASGLLGAVALLTYLAIMTSAALRAAKWTGGASAGLLGLLLVRCVTESPLRGGLDVGLLVHAALLAATFAGLRARSPEVRQRSRTLERHPVHAAAAAA